MTDKDALDVLFVQAVRENSLSLFRAARSILHRDCDAEDAVSTAVERCYRSIRRIRDWDRASSYLMRAVINASYDLLRRRKRETPVEAPDLDWSQAQEEESPVWMYLSHLPPKARLILQLRFGEDMAVKEIANLLHLPRGSVSVTIGRSLKKLKSDLTQEDSSHA